MGIQEGLWDCPNCEGTNRGAHLKCQGCGATREEDVEFYLPEDAVDILPDNPLYAVAEAGADWICPYCDTSNRATDPHCTNCGGAEKKEGTEREVKDVEDPSQEKLEEETKPTHPAAKPESSGGSGCLKYLGMGILLFFVLGWYLSRTHQVGLKVTRTLWSRTIETERYGTYDEEAWRSQLPSGAKEYASTRKVRDYKQVFDHYETRTQQKSRQVKTGSEQYVCGKTNMGNGFFKDKYCSRDTYRTENYTESYQEKIYRKEPIYDDWVSYKIDRWKEANPLPTSGEDHKPVWANMVPTSTYRETARKAKYTLFIEDPKKKQNWEFEVPEERFAKFPPGTEVVGTVSNAGSLKAVLLPGEKPPKE